jgi:anti-sigma factor RsiW
MAGAALGNADGGPERLERMIVPEPCEMVLLVQAEFDGELDAGQAASLQIHRAQCPVCQGAELELARARELVRELSYRTIPDAVRERVLAGLAAARPTPARGPAMSRLSSRFHSWGHSAMGFSLGAACTAAVVFIVLSPAQQSLTEQVIAGHVRALQPGHLEDVPSTDQHTVKPWFDGRIDFAPPVKDLALKGFPLQGGRLDYIGGRPVAALIYQRDKHIIDLFAWPAAGDLKLAPEFTEHNGYNVLHWVENNTELWAVSDIAPDQLHKFVSDWERSP